MIFYLNIYFNHRSYEVQSHEYVKLPMVERILKREKSDFFSELFIIKAMDRSQSSSLNFQGIEIIRSLKKDVLIDREKAGVSEATYSNLICIPSRASLQRTSKNIKHAQNLMPLRRD